MKKSKKQMQGKSGTGKIRNSEDQKQRILGTKNIRKCENQKQAEGSIRYGLEKNAGFAEKAGRRV